ncbi:MAG: hypothetical protein LBF38_01165 [Deltaproteobacteria bacterium]|jgi:hypothetical protein|nr:hypothetical protein [Deltaproteobacteria bacterium]
MYEIDNIYGISVKVNQGEDFGLSLANFLEDFYYFGPEVKAQIIQDRPLDMPNIAQVPFLAATAHKLANDYKLAVPPWVFEKRCYLPGDSPYFGCRKGKLSLFFMFTSPSEFKHRNLFVDENVLLRV